MDWIDSIQQLADLSKILLDKNEAEEIAKDMASVMALMDTLKNVELPQEDISIKSIGLNDLREDRVCESLDPAVLMSQCSGKHRNCFAIPRML